VSRLTAWFTHLAALLVGGTGLAYGWARYFGQPADEFAIGHPAEPHLMHAHIVLAPLLIFACGLLWRDHVWKRVASGFPKRRHTGLVIFATAWPMILSGVAIQAAVDDDWRLIWAWIHGIASVLWVLGYAAHQLSRRPA